LPGGRTEAAGRAVAVERQMKPDVKSVLPTALYALLALACFFLMYVSFRHYATTNPEFNSLATGILGTIAGFFLSMSADVETGSRLASILSTTLVKETEQQAKTAQQARDLYQQELRNLQGIIQQEGNRLLMQRMREVHIEEAAKRLQEIEVLDLELSRFAEQVQTPEVEAVRRRLEDVLASVRNPEEDDRLIKQLCYSIPVFGGLLYLSYMIAKKLSPGLQARVHRQLNQFTSLADRRGLRFLVGAILLGALLLALALILLANFAR
jgi:hypothetical protein